MMQDPPVTFAERLEDATSALNLAVERAREAVKRLSAILGEHFVKADVPLDDVPPDER
jgi:hypothetical protein